MALHSKIGLGWFTKSDKIVAPVVVKPEVASNMASAVLRSGRASIKGSAQINGIVHHRKFTTIIPKRADILGVSPRVANRINIHPNPDVSPDHKKGSPPLQPIPKAANQGININKEKMSPTSATIWLAALNSLESIGSSYDYYISRKTTN